MTVQPLRDFLVVTKDKTSDRTEGGLLYKPETVDEKVVTGTVVAVGSGRVTMDGTVVPLEVKKEDKVLFNKNMATEFKVGDQTLFLLREDQVMCVLK